ncbi:MAG: NAD-dependent epimerase/dehydratase family protein [Pseudomonadota bacterium]
MTGFDTCIAGLGYTGRVLADALVADGRSVITMARGDAHGDVPHWRADVDDASSLIAPPTIDSLAYLIPPGVQDNQEVRFARLIDALPQFPKRIVLASTTGVYGNHSGGLVDETTPTAPESQRAKGRVMLEASARALCDANGAELCILRIAGIYGPGRLPIEAIKRLDPIIDPVEANPGNRIHVEDLAAIFAAAFAHQSPPPIVNVCDGDYTTSPAFTLMVADALELPAPPVISLAEAAQHYSPMRMSFIHESRTIVNDVLLNELGVTLRYPTAAAGMQASLP